MVWGLESKFLERKNINDIFLETLKTWENTYNRTFECFYYFELFIYAIPYEQDRSLLKKHGHGQFFLCFFDKYIKNILSGIQI